MSDSENTDSDNFVECKYGHHIADKNLDFTSSGLNSVYSICRKCCSLRSAKYRQSHKNQYNDSRREYYRLFMAQKRAKDKLNNLIQLSA